MIQTYLKDNKKFPKNQKKYLMIYLFKKTLHYLMHKTKKIKKK